MAHSSELTPAAVGRRKEFRRVLRLLWRVFGRFYALGLIVLIGWLTFSAVSYLFTSLAFESGPPAKITALPTRLTPDVLQRDWTAWQALSATENARSPLAHYHRLDHWMEPDHFNDCARSGCHAALPHSRHKEVRAFLNMHATSIHCGVCHMKNEAKTLPLVWYDLQTGQPCERPALLAAYDMLTNDATRHELEQGSPELQRKFVELLRDAEKAARGSPVLEKLADHFAALRPGSAAYVKLIGETASVLPRHFRGEYGKKLAIRGESGGPILGHPNTAQAIEAWFSRPPGHTKEENKPLLAAVHPLKRATPRNCADCHTTDGSLVDFAAAGYPSARRDALTGGIIFRMIEHIATSQPMHMPQIAAPTAAPTTQPVSR